MLARIAISDDDLELNGGELDGEIVRDRIEAADDGMLNLHVTERHERKALKDARRLVIANLEDQLWREVLRAHRQIRLDPPF